MGKSKVVGNIHILDNRKTKEEKEEDKKELFENIKSVLFPVWQEKSQVSITLTDMYACWEYLLEMLYHGRGLNINAIKNQIEYHKERR